MYDYNPSTKLYLVKRVFIPNHLLEKKKKLSEGGSGGESEGGSDSGSESDGSNSNLNKRGMKTSNNIEEEDDIHYWVPRVRLMFAAEDPQVFAERVSNAYNLREKTEALLR